MGKTMNKEEREKQRAKYRNPDSYYDGVPPYIKEMSAEELDLAIAEEEARLRAESEKSDAA
jgi:hypothetical protein